MTMRRVRIVNQTRGTGLAEQAEVAQSFLARSRGLLGRRDWSQADGLVIDPCNGVHTWLMHLSIDVAYVGRDGVVRRLVPTMRPWRLGPIVFGARYVLELPAGTFDRTGTVEGDRIALEPLPSTAP
ncbi:MAG: DUF192 domain-containing protein [Chloroflexi bacterium]|nr:DUF192 domain-containing protein [Chloroflexota bacterium]